MNCLNCYKPVKKSNKFCSNRCQKEYEYKGANREHGRKQRKKYEK